MTEHQKENIKYQEALHKNLVAHQSLLRLVSAILSSAIAISSFFGLREIVGGTGLSAKIVPLILAGTIGTMFWFAWHKMFSTLPIMESKRRRHQQIAVAALIVVVQTLFSAWPLATTIAGSSAVTAHLANNEKEVRAALMSAYQLVAAQNGLVGKVDIAAASDLAQAQLEIKSGAHSGKRGNGMVASAFTTAADNLSNMAATMRQMQKTADGQNEAGQEITKQMDRLVASNDLNTADRQRQYADLVSQASDIVQHLNQTDLTTPLSGLIGGIAYRGGSADQRTASEGVQREVKLFGDNLKQEAKSYKKVSLPEIEPFVPMSAGMAVLAYAQELPMGWGMALGLDFLPFLLLIGTMISWLDVRSPPNEPHPFEAPEALSPSPPAGSGNSVVRIIRTNGETNA